MCYICDEPIDMTLHKDHMHVDHIEPTAEGGSDTENNFALTHASCNRSKGASDLRVAKRIVEFDNLQEKAREEGKRGANLGDVLAVYQGAKERLSIKVSDAKVEFSFPESGDNEVHSAPLYQDKLSGSRFP